ncbi:MAG: ABC transporter permease [Candidatus Odyssella sp.]|nr:ABC transporter permease [Candidatus Odyssella sp.]
MTYGDCIRASITALKANLLRSILTSLGIIIGISSVIAMVAIGAGAESRVKESIESLGSNIMIVLNGSRTTGGARGGTGSNITLTEEDAAALQRDVASVEVAAPSVQGRFQLVFGNTNWSTNIHGITEEYMTARNWQVDQGRGFNDTEYRSAGKVALIGATVAEKLFPGEDPIGKVIRINKVPVQVVGVLAAKGQTPFGQDQDDTSFIPITTAKKRVLGGRWVKSNLVSQITVKVRDAQDVAEAEREVTTLLRQRHRIPEGGQDDFNIRNISQFLAARAESTRVMGILLASVAAISLVVGGIGIMNIMLVSVTERTREIGLRMALGARRRDILTQFVVEAITLSLLGGLIGVALGIGGSHLIAKTGDWPVLIEPQAIMMAVGFSAAVGVFFGFYPARKASKLDPIDALRYE